MVQHDAARVERKREALDGDPALHARVPRENDDAVATFAELGERAVAVKNELLLHAPPDSAVGRYRPCGHSSRALRIKRLDPWQGTRYCFEPLNYSMFELKASPPA